MGRYLELCKFMIKKECFYKRIKFAERVVKQYKLTGAEAIEFLDFIFYESIQERDRLLTNEEMDKKYNRLMGIALKKENDRYIKYSNEIFEYNKQCKMYEDMERKHNRFLSQR